jgi:hypothetical protein
MDLGVFPVVENEVIKSAAEVRAARRFLHHKCIERRKSQFLVIFR